MWRFYIPTWRMRPTLVRFDPNLCLLFMFLIYLQISDVLEAMCAKVEESYYSWSIANLEQGSRQAQQQAEAQRLHWSKLSTELKSVTHAASSQVQTAQASTNAAESDLDNACRQVKQLEEHEAWLDARNKTSKHDSRDLTSLPKLVLRSLVTYLGKPDLARAIQSCHRWQVTLERGYLWKALAVRSVFACVVFCLLSWFVIAFCWFSFA